MQYRVYPLDSVGKIKGPGVDVELEADHEALVRANRARTINQGAEVWIGSQMVCHVPPFSRQPLGRLN